MKGLGTVSFRAERGIRDSDYGFLTSFGMTKVLLPAALFTACLGLYVSTRSPSLDDFDSFNFARAIDRFDVRANQPQPPGYPVYVFLARIFSVAAGDHQLALTLLSATAAALAVLAFYGLASDLSVPWAAAPLAVAPLFWLTAGMALSDAPGLAFATAAVLLLVRGVRDRRAFAGGCALLGLTLGVRPQDAIVPAGVLLAWTGPRIIHEWRLLIRGALVFGMAVLVWAIPLVMNLGGIPAALGIMARQSGYVGSTDSLLARPLTQSGIVARLAEFGSVFSAYFGGPADGGLPAFLALTVSLTILAIIAGRIRWLALSWLLPYVLFMVLFLRPDDPRKVLPAIPPMLLLLAGLRPRIAAGLACAGLMVWFGFTAAPLLRTLDTVKSPPEQAAAYVGSAFSPNDTLVVAGSSYNAIRYRAPAFKAYLVDELDQAAVDRDLAGGSYRNLVVLDKEGFRVPEDFVGVDMRSFQRDPLVLPKAATVWLSTYRPLAELRGGDLALPSGPVHIGTAEDVRFVMDGWYRPEIIGGNPARWSDLHATVRFWVEDAREATLQLVGVAYPGSQRLAVEVNGQQAAELPLGTDWAPLNIPVPRALLHEHSINVVALEHGSALSAYDMTQGVSLDRRRLAAAYSSFELIWR